MEAWDSGSKIRPLPIDDIDGDAPQHRPVEPPPRRWLPLAVIVLGALAFAVVARGLGLAPSSDVGTATTSPPGLSEQAAAPPSTEPAPPPPPQLVKLLPFATDDLQLVTVAGSASIGRWELNETAPAFGANIGQAISAEYNADGAFLAVHSRVRNGSITVTDGDGYNPIYLPNNVLGAAWHPTDPTLLAWTATGDRRSADAATTFLRVADISGYDGAALEPLFEVTLPEGPYELVAWGDWGFVTLDVGRAFSPVTIFDSDGLNPVDLDGAFFDATPDGTLLMARTDDAGYMPYLVAPDGTEIELVGLDLGGIDFRITTNAEWVLALTPQADGRTSIVARTVWSRSTRLNSIDAPARIVGLSPDDRYVIMQDTETRDLVFKDWNTGAEHRVPMDVQVAAAFL